MKGICHNKEYCSVWMSRKVPECDVNTRDECGDTKLVWAACEGQLEEVRRLVGRGAELNIRNRAANKQSAKLSQSPPSRHLVGAFS